MPLHKSLRGGDWFTLSGGVLVPKFRGALVKKAADQTAANYTTATAIAWDAEDYDTDGIHDNASNNSRLSVPAGVTKVRCHANVDLNSLSANLWVALVIRKNGSASYNGAPSLVVETGAAFANLNVSSPPLTVAGGTDYFESYLTILTDTSITVVAATSWFAMELIA